MVDMEYCTYRDGKYVKVPKIDDLCLALKEKFLSQQETIDKLKKENKRIKDEKYASEELLKMKKQLDDMRKEYYNGFPISDEEVKTINNWKREHDREKHNAATSEERLKLEGAAGGRFKYIFNPTSLGVVCKIKCNCGDEFCFRGLM